MPKDAGAKASRLAELRRNWYERPKTVQTPAATPARNSNQDSEPANVIDLQEAAAGKQQDEATAKKGRRGVKKTADVIPLESALQEQAGPE